MHTDWKSKAGWNSDPKIFMTLMNEEKRCGQRRGCAKGACEAFLYETPPPNNSRTPECESDNKTRVAFCGLVASHLQMVSSQGIAWEGGKEGAGRREGERMYLGRLLNLRMAPTSFEFKVFQDLGHVQHFCTASQRHQMQEERDDCRKCVCVCVCVCARARACAFVLERAHH